ncbi:MAG: hypothetical protein KY460_06960 [Actinobacteria bacterium]|nr:hypothetical protein [Actinomycetota bacterium]
MARTFQNIELFENLTVIQNLMLGRHHHVTYRWWHALAWVGRALAMEPRLLLLDEPVAGMNNEETEDMARFILDIRDELAIPMILVEHDMGVVMDLADRILVVDFGQPITTGPPEEVQSHPDVISAYLGEDHAVATPGEDDAEEALT